mgnify:CR=1 FL=1
MLPITTRLRYVTSPEKSGLSAFCDLLGKRIEVKQIIWDGKEWVLWFVPDDKGPDIFSGTVNSKGQYAKPRARKPS